MKRLAVVILSLVAAFASFTPAQALPVITTLDMPAAQPANVQQVRDRRFNRRHGWSGNRRHGWNGNRGHYRYNRYRRHNNRAGAIIGGLAAGAIIGGVLSSAARSNSGGSHAQRCYARYRSYRASDNTYQPYSGPRQRCVL